MDVEIFKRKTKSDAHWTRVTTATMVSPTVLVCKESGRHIFKNIGVTGSMCRWGEFITSDGKRAGWHWRLGNDIDVNQYIVISV